MGLPFIEEGNRKENGRNLTAKLSWPTKF